MISVSENVLLTSETTKTSPLSKIVSLWLHGLLFASDITETAQIQWIVTQLKAEKCIQIQWIVTQLKAEKCIVMLRIICILF